MNSESLFIVGYQSFQAYCHSMLQGRTAIENYNNNMILMQYKLNKGFQFVFSYLRLCSEAKVDCLISKFEYVLIPSLLCNYFKNCNTEKCTRHKMCV
jgi:hypothetical protein